MSDLPILLKYCITLFNPCIFDANNLFTLLTHAMEYAHILHIGSIDHLLYYLALLVDHILLHFPAKLSSAELH